MGYFSIIPPIMVKGKAKMGFQSSPIREIRVDSSSLTINLNPVVAHAIELDPDIELILWGQEHIHQLNQVNRLGNLFPRLGQTEVLEVLAIGTGTHIISHIKSPESAYIDLFTTKSLPFSLYTQSGRMASRAFGLQEIPVGFINVLEQLTIDSVEDQLEQTIASFRRNILKRMKTQLEKYEGSELLRMSHSVDLISSVKHTLEATDQIVHVVEGTFKKVEERDWAYYSITAPLLRSIRFQKHLEKYCQITCHKNQFELKVAKTKSISANKIVQTLVALFTQVNNTLE
ncbi:MAG: hypothetical protein ACFFCQ_14270 [Promethearchaeota archaeon]